MISCEWYPNCELCDNNNWCYFKDDEVAFIENNLFRLYKILNKLFELHKHKEEKAYFIQSSFDEIDFGIDSILEDIFKLYKIKKEKKVNYERNNGLLESQRQNSS